MSRVLRSCRPGPRTVPEYGGIHLDVALEARVACRQQMVPVPGSVGGRQPCLPAEHPRPPSPVGRASHPTPARRRERSVQTRPGHLRADPARCFPAHLAGIHPSCGGVGGTGRSGLQSRVLRRASGIDDRLSSGGPTHDPGGFSAPCPTGYVRARLPRGRIAVKAARRRVGSRRPGARPGRSAVRPRPGRRPRHAPRDRPPAPVRRPRVRRPGRPGGLHRRPRPLARPPAPARRPRAHRRGRLRRRNP